MTRHRIAVGWLLQQSGKRGAEHGAHADCAAYQAEQAGRCIR